VVNLRVARSTDLTPEVARTPAGFVLYYTLRGAASGRQCISVATAERPEGPFRDTRDRPLVCQEQLGGSIDPHRFGVRNDAAWEGDLIEAPTLWRDGDTYYLFYSANDYGSPGYAVDYATATKVLGPYRDGPGNPILRSRGKAAGPGGQRSMWLDRLSVADGRPRVAGPIDTPQEAP
jgi:beta-xylosidase